ncbi:MAG: type II secretion system F family protein [Candidatus Bathyarchaeia archaeon]
MKRVSKKTRQATAIASVIVAAAILYTFFVFRVDDATKYMNELFLFSVLAVAIPSSILDFEHSRWINAIDDQMPTFVREISEAYETGLTLVGAFEHVVKSGVIKKPLSDEIKRITAQMSWGLTFEEALGNFKERIDSPVVNRFCALVLEASRSGGEIRKVFIATSGFMEEMRESDREADANMRPYLLIVYVAFAVFLWIGVILLQSFFKPLEASKQILSSLSIVGLKEYKDFFYKTMIVSGAMGGLMAGKIGERRIAGGLKHSTIMVIAGYIVFFLLVPPNWMEI